MSTYASAPWGASAYAQVGMQTGVTDASPHRLIEMLFQGARQAVALARMHLQKGDMAGKGLAISKAINIIGGGLQQSLNRTQGGEMAERLDALYTYMARQLLHANLNKDETLLIEVDGLLATLEEAWEGIAPQAAIRQPMGSPVSA